MTLHLAPNSAPRLPGVGDQKTFADPASGATFTTSVPTSKAWRLWGGSAKFVTNASAGNRQVGLLISNNGIPIYFSGNSFAIGASQTRFVTFYDQKLLQDTDWALTWYVVGLRAIWLPAGTQISFPTVGQVVGDQFSQIHLLVEEADV